LAANSLAKTVSPSQQSGLITGLADNLVQKGVGMLQYADDTILLIQVDLEQARNLKHLLNPCDDARVYRQIVGTPSAECHSKRSFPHKGDSRVNIELLGNWLRVISSFSSSSNPAKQSFVWCPQLQRVVVKHKVYY
jgi:hypothetical protein